MKIIDNIVNWFNDIKKRQEIADHLEWMTALSQVSKFSMIHYNELAEKMSVGGINLDHLYKYPITVYSPVLGFHDPDKVYKNQRPVAGSIITCEPQLKKIPFHTELDIPSAYSIFLPAKRVEDIRLIILLNQRLANWYKAFRTWNNSICKAVLFHELGHIAYGHHETYINAINTWSERSAQSGGIKNVTLDDAITLVKASYGTIPLIDSEEKELEADRYAIYSGYSSGLYLFFMVSLYQIKYLKAKGRISNTEVIEEHILMRLAQVLKAVGICEERAVSGKKIRQLEDTLQEGIVISVLSDVDLVNVLHETGSTIDFFVYFIVSASQMASALDPAYGALDPLVRANLFDRVNGTRRLIQYANATGQYIRDEWKRYEEALYQWQYLLENDKFDELPKIILDGQQNEVLKTSKDLFRASNLFIKEHL